MSLRTTPRTPRVPSSGADLVETGPLKEIGTSNGTRDWTNDVFVQSLNDSVPLRQPTLAGWVLGSIETTPLRGVGFSLGP